MKKWILFVGIVFALGYFFGEPPPDGQAASAETQKTASGIDGVIKVNDPGFSAPADTMIIDVKANSLWSLATDSHGIFKQIKEDFPAELDGYRKIWMFANSDLVDKYGNKSVDRTMGIEWPTAELKQANFESSSFLQFNLLNLASDVRGFDRAGHEEFIEYCKDEDKLNFTRQFCALYLLKYK